MVNEKRVAGEEEEDSSQSAAVGEPARVKATGETENKHSEKQKQGRSEK